MRCERLVTKPFQAAFDSRTNTALTPGFITFQINYWIRRNTIEFNEIEHEHGCSIDCAKVGR